MTRALERHKSRQARVIPIILRPCDWQTSRFAKLQALPRDARPIIEWQPPDAGYLDTTRGLRRVVSELRGSASPQKPPVPGEQEPPAEEPASPAPPRARLSLWKTKFFVSYARNDEKFALQLANDLRAAGANLWLDQLDIEVGDRWDRAVEKALETCDGMLVVLSPDSVSSDNVMDEVAYALDKGKRIIPVVSRKCEIPFRLRRIQHIDFTATDEQTGLTRVLAALRIETRPIRGATSPALTGASPESELNAGDLRVNPVDHTELVLIPAGPFKAGSKTEADNPPREMSLPAFYLARYPVTNAQYGELLKANPQVKAPEYWDNERFNQPQQPVIGVSWEEARAYCEWAGLRLATEWEWEKGARGTDGRTYPWGEEEPDASRATFGDPNGQPTPVGSCPAGASPYGLLDMTGNVWEWTASSYKWWGALRTVRGGSFDDDPQNLRAASRDYAHADDRGHGIGFRCARDP